MIAQLFASSVLHIINPRAENMNLDGLSQARNTPHLSWIVPPVTCNVYLKV
jgi:hypothetical protein